MALVGKNPTNGPKARVDEPGAAQMKSGISSRTDTARYIAEICDEMALMAKGAQLTFLAHLLAMAQAEAEAEYAAGVRLGPTRHTRPPANTSLAKTVPPARSAGGDIG